MKTFFVALGAWLSLADSALAAGSDAHALVREAIAAMDDGHDLHGIASIRASALKTSHDIVEFDHPDAPYVSAGVSRLAVMDDLRHGRRLVEETPLDADPSAPAPRRRILIAADAQQTDTVLPGQSPKPVRSTAPPGWRVDEPIRALLLAEHALDLERLPDVALHGIPQQVIAFHRGRYPVRIYLDAATHLPSALETTITLRRATSSDIAWNAWGDLTDRTELMNYALVDGIRYPAQSDLFRNGVPLSTTVRGETHLDRVPAEEAAFAMAPAPAPAGLRDVDELALGEPIGQAPAPNKPIAEIAPGIVQIPGSWYSTIVRQDDGLVIIDAPISAGYSARVLDEAARRFPGVPVKAVIASTAFYWHIAGLRTYAARGIPIYTRDRNVLVVRALLAAPHTLSPDELARRPRAPEIHAVSAPVTIGRGRNAITVMPIPDGEQPMVMSWIADAHLLHTAEMVQPLGPKGALLYPESLLELTHTVQRAKIPTAGLRMIGMHMSPTPWDTLESTLRAAGG